MLFRPTEVLFSPTEDCNLSCVHCVTPKSRTMLPVKTAGSFLLQCKKIGINRVSFTGGEPFLNPKFLYSLTRLAVREGLIFGRIMTNGVWYKNTGEMKSVLKKLYMAGYDGDITVSVDAFHRQSTEKLGRFIDAAISIWNRPDIVSIAWVGGAREDESMRKIRRLLRHRRGASIRVIKIGLSPVSGAAKLKNPWGKRWFKEDHCKGPGNVLFVTAEGDVKPCCGYATDLKALTIGNIRRDTAGEIVGKARDDDYVRSVFSRGLTGIRRRLERIGFELPGKTDNHCFFCHYLLTTVPKNILKKALYSLLIIFALASGVQADEVSIDRADNYERTVAKVVKKIPLPKWYHEGILIDGKSIWVANGENGKIWVLDTKSKKVVSTIEPPAGFTEAVIDAGGGKYLVTDWDDKKLYQTRLVKNEMVIETVLTDFAPAHPAGAVSAGGRIFVTLWTRGLGTKFEIVELDKDFKEIGRMSLKEIQEPSQMAWDGRNLWITSWYNSRAYKVDVSSWKVLSSFRAPFNKATGIAWDGKYFWMTGTYADLYQLSVD